MSTFDNPALAAEYDQAFQPIRIEFSRVAAVAAIIMVPGGTLLDQLLYPDRAAEFFVIRCLAALVIVAAFAAYRHATWKTHTTLITLLWASVIQIMIAGMIGLTDGAASHYYAGMNLTLFAAAIVLPLRAREFAVFALFSLAAYLTACVVNTAPLLTPVFGANLFFVVMTAVIGGLAAHINERRRQKEFLVSRQIGAENAALAERDRLKDMFIANVSHELRTPLTVILAPIQEMLARRRELPHWIGERLRIVNQNAERLLRQVNDLLDVLKMDAGQYDMILKPVDASAVVSQQIEGIAPWISSKRLRLSTRIDPVPGTVLGDKEALIKIVQNLLSNAIKFSEAGGQLRINVQVEPRTWTLTIADTGIGIPADRIDTIFNRFEQVDNSLTRKHHGSGIGLALVKQLTEAMKGRIEVTSQEHQGTTMRLMLPTAKRTPTAVPDATEAAAPLPPLVAAIGEPGGTDHPPRQDDDPSRPTLLIVEDDEAIGDYLETLFATRFTVQRERNGASGLARAKSDKPALLLLDYMLPDQDGLSIAAALKRDPTCQNIKILVLTARTDEDIKLQALKQGADDFLTKPFSPAEVTVRVDNLLLSHHLEAGLRQSNDELQETLAALKASQAHLIQSEKLNSVGALSAGLLHEINNPLNYAVTAVSYAQTRPAANEDEQIAEALDDIKNGMDRIAAIIRDLRAFAHPDARIKTARFTLATAISQALRLTQHEIKHLTVDNQVPADLQASGSESHMVQVLVNLLVNSSQAIEDGQGSSGRITLSAEAGPRIRIGVADNGIGMNEGTVARCLDPFFTTRDVGQGMGMGLAIVQTIVHEHGGEIAIHSQPGQGTRIVFDIPADHADD